MTISSFTSEDAHYMARAIRLAERGRYTTDPNPRVGCVIVRDKQVLAEGWHRVAGQAHAEVDALAKLDGSAEGATAYVTLEPCSHHGRTGPCAQALVESGVAAVVIAMLDPNPLVAGRGVELLEQAGVCVRSGLMEQEARALNKGFLSRMERKRPWVTIKLAMSLDGRTAMASGESKWITGAEARKDVQRLRAESSAIVTGIGTVLSDDPALTVRPEESDSAEGFDKTEPRQPLRVVLDAKARLSGREKIFQNLGHVLYVFGEGLQAAEAIKALAHVELLPLSLSDSGHVNLSDLLESLSKRECNQLMVEAGAGLSGAFLREGLWDELRVYVAPKILGSSARPMFDLPLDSMSQSYGLQWLETRQLGCDTRLIYRPGQADC